MSLDGIFLHSCAAGRESWTSSPFIRLDEEEEKEEELSLLSPQNKTEAFISISHKSGRREGR